jgi:hypothetical protein
MVKSEESFKGLKILCFLSVLGFVYCMAFDSTKLLTYSSLDVDSMVEDSASYEMINNELLRWTDSEIDVSKKGLQKVSLLFLIRSILDVLALLGVALMFYRMKIGFSIYAIFQLCYVVSPFVFFGINGTAVAPLNMMAINLIYLALFFTQEKNLLSRDK